ncbi:MAG: hypothetical protein CL398_07570 [Acidiferrobacteraceae bacterium]|nr:hypothetical protein [Acidiferrobacteraceae bacterium]
MPEKNHFFDNKQNVRLIMWLLVAICFVLVIIDLIVHRHVVHPIEALWSFYAWFGFISCVFLVLVSKLLRKILMRREDYYDAND